MVRNGKQGGPWIRKVQRRSEEGGGERGRGEVGVWISFMSHSLWVIRFDDSTAFYIRSGDSRPKTETPDRFVFAFVKVRNVVTWIIVQFVFFFPDNRQELVISKHDRLLDKLLDLLQPAEVLLLLLDVDVLGNEDCELGVDAPLGEV